MPTAEILQTDIPTGVVVGVVLVPALLALERLSRPIVVVGKPTRRATLRRIAWVNLYGFDAVFVGLVFDIFEEASTSAAAG